MYYTLFRAEGDILGELAYGRQTVLESLLGNTAAHTVSSSTARAHPQTGEPSDNMGR